MTHYPIYGNVSRWVFSGVRERGRPFGDYGLGPGGFQEDGGGEGQGHRLPGSKFRPAEGMYIPPQAEMFANAYAYNAGHVEQDNSQALKRSDSDSVPDGHVLLRKVRGRVEASDKYESLNPSANHHHEYLEGHNFSQDSSTQHLDCFKNANDGKKRRPSKSNRSVQLYRRQSERSESTMSENVPESFSSPRRHASYQNYMMESNVNSEGASMAIIESSLVSRGDSHNSEVLREILKKEMEQEEADTGDDVQDSTFCSDFDESVKEDEDPIPAKNDNDHNDVYENGGIIKMLLREMQGSGRLKRPTSTSYENEISGNQQVGSYENEEVVKKMPCVSEDIASGCKEAYENEALGHMVPGSYENEEIVNKMPTPKENEDIHYTPNVPYENEFSVSQHPGSYENEEVVRKMPYTPYGEECEERNNVAKDLLRERTSVKSHAQSYDATSLGSINQILKQFEFDDETDGISTKPESLDENVYSCLEDHLMHQNKIYNASTNTYLEPASSGADHTDTQYIGAVDSTSEPIVPPRLSRKSNVCRSLSSMNTPIYENLPFTQPFPFSPEPKDTRIIASNLALNNDPDAWVQSPDELFYAVTPAVSSLDTLAVGSPNVFLQSPMACIQGPSTFTYVTTDGFAMSSASHVVPSASQVFMKEEFEHQLDIEARKIHTRAVLYIQKFIRMHLARQKFLLVQQKTIKIQAAFRMRLAR